MSSTNHESTYPVPPPLERDFYDQADDQRDTNASIKDVSLLPVDTAGVDFIIGTNEEKHPFIGDLLEKGGTPNDINRLTVKWSAQPVVIVESAPEILRDGIESDQVHVDRTERINEIAHGLREIVARHPDVKGDMQQWITEQIPNLLTEMSEWPPDETAMALAIAVGDESVFKRVAEKLKKEMRILNAHSVAATFAMGKIAVERNLQRLDTDELSEGVPSIRARFAEAFARFSEMKKVEKRIDTTALRFDHSVGTDLPAWLVVPTVPSLNPGETKYHSASGPKQAGQTRRIAPLNRAPEAVADAASQGSSSKPRTLPASTEHKLLAASEEAQSPDLTIFKLSDEEQKFIDFLRRRTTNGHEMSDEYIVSIYNSAGQLPSELEDTMSHIVKKFQGSLAAPNGSIG